MDLRDIFQLHLTKEENSNSLMVPAIKKAKTVKPKKNTDRATSPVPVLVDPTIPRNEEEWE